MENLITETYLDGITLRDYQLSAFHRAISRKEGILEIGTGGGKTEIILAILKYLLEKGIITEEFKALIVVPSVFIAEQSYERAIKRGLNPFDCSIIGDGGKDFNRKILFCVINTLFQSMERKGVLEIISNTSCLIFDEAHHVQANMFKTIVLASNPEYQFGFSGSPFVDSYSLKDYRDALTIGLLGSLIFKLPQQILRKEKHLAEPVVFFKALPGLRSNNKSFYDSLYKKHIIRNTERNKIILDYLNLFYEMNFITMVIVNQIEHGILLLKDCPDQTIFVTGNGNCHLKEEGSIREQNMDFHSISDLIERGIIKNIICTQVFDEGVDIPAINAIIMAQAQRGKIKFQQRLGRGLRKKNDLNRVYILDFIDNAHVYFYSQSKKRMNYYRELKCYMILKEELFNSILKKHLELVKLV